MKKAVKKKVVSKAVVPVTVSFVLDETGSMEVCRQATISGFNEYVQELQKKSSGIKMTLTLFNSDKTEVRYSDVVVKEVKPLTRETYSPAGMTPLYDAIGLTIKKIGDKKAGTLVVIMTDGEENASKEFTREKIFDLIKQKEADGWTFVYLGANHDSWTAGQAIGLHKGNTMNYNQNMTKGTMKAMAGAVQCYASMSTQGAPAMNSFFKQSGYIAPTQEDDTTQ